jgi:hypothetical protein
MFINSCDEIKNPLKPNTGKCGDDSQPVPIRKILVEDYTGHTCGNCPRAAEQISYLQKNYCDYIVPVAVHVGSFANPTTQFPDDFRTPVGTELDQFFGISSTGLPQGMVNRTPYNSNKVLVYADWTAAVDVLLATPPQMYITLQNNFNTGDSIVTISVRTDILKDISDNLSLSVYLTEDSIISPQKDYSLPSPSIVTNYVHKHMLRTTANGTWGDQISEEPVKFGATIEKTYSVKISSKWKPDHCNVVAFVFKTDSKEVVQAETEPVLDVLKK